MDVGYIHEGYANAVDVLATDHGAIKVRIRNALPLFLPVTPTTLEGHNVIDTHLKELVNMLTKYGTPLETIRRIRSKSAVEIAEKIVEIEYLLRQLNMLNHDC